MKHLGLFFTAVAGIALTVAPQGRAQATNTQARAQLLVPSFGFGPAGGIISDKAHVPFSGVLVQELERTLNDGTNILRDTRLVVMRDGSGRIYRAREIKSPGRNESAHLHSITITDPIAHVQYFCGPSPAKFCSKVKYRPFVRRPRVLADRKMPNVNIEELGTSEINGIEATGERITRIIPEGSEGNDRAFQIVQERWHAADLDVDVLVKQSDPRRGTWTTNLTDLSLGEPDPKFFQVPEGYKVREMRGTFSGMVPAEEGNGPHYPNGILGPIVPPNR